MAQSDILICDLVRQHAIEKLGREDDRVDQLVSAYRSSLSEPDEKKRTDACVALWKFGPLAKVTLPAYVEALRNGGLQDRIRASIAIRYICGAGSAVPALLEVLEDPNPEMRENAALALAAVRPPARAAASKLLGRLDDDSAAVREAVLCGLANTGRGNEQVELAVAKATSDPAEQIRRTAAHALGNVGAARLDVVVPTLVKCLQDADAEVRYRAAQSLGWLGDPARDAVPALLNALRDEDDIVRDRAMLALGCMGSPGEEIINELIDMLNDDRVDVREAAAMTFDHLQYPATAALPRLLQHLNDPNEDASVRSWCASAIGEIGCEIDALPILRSYARADEPSAHLPFVALGEAAVPTLIEMLDDEACAREVAAFAISQIGAGAIGAVPTLIELLAHEDADHRLDAVAALSGIGPVIPAEATAPAIPRLTELLDDTDEAVQSVAIEALGAHGSPEAISTLIGRLENAGDEETCEILAAIGKAREPDGEVLDVLVRHLDQASEDVQVAALTALGEIAPRTDQFPREVMDCLGRENPNDVRRWAANALADSRKWIDESTPALFDCALDASCSLRCAALSALAIGADAQERTIRLLIECLGHPDHEERTSVMATLGNMGTAAIEAIPVLKQCLHDADPYIRTDAEEAIQKISNQDTPPND